jgi:hypothetical protein
MWQAEGRETKTGSRAAGEKLTVVSWEKDGDISCISLIKAEDLTEMVKNVLGPVMKEIL